MTLQITALLNFDDIDELTGLYFEDRLSVDSIQAMLEGFQGKAVIFRELVGTIDDCIVNEEN